MSENQDHREDSDCDCAICREGMETYRAWEAEAMAKHGWLRHYVGDDPDSPSGINHHTHGLLASFGHPDIQIVGKLTQEKSAAVMVAVVNRIKEGEKFKAGDVLEGILRDAYLIKLVDAVENGRPVLRLIFPDPQNQVDRDKMTEPWMSDQYGDLAEV
jgi:hypothetical protein